MEFLAEGQNPTKERCPHHYSSVLDSSRLGKPAFDCSIQLSELDWVHEFNARVTSDHNSLLARLSVDALDVHSGSSSLGISLFLIVGTDTVLKGLAAGGHADVFDANMDALGDDAVSNALVHNDTDGVSGHVEDLAGLSVIEFVGHTSLDGTISDDIDEVSFAVGNEVLAEGRHTVLSECLAEKISRASSKTETVGHFSFKPSKYLIIKKSPAIWQNLNALFLADIYHAGTPCYD